MIKTLAFLFISLMAIASTIGYLVLTQKITAGEKLVATGQNFIAQQGPSLEQGKADLASGKNKLTEGYKEYDHAQDNPFLVFADKWFNGGKGFAEGRNKIAKGEEKVAKGEDKVDVGQKQLDKGNLAVQVGMKKLQQGKTARNVCALGAIIFTLLSIAFGISWRQSLQQFVRNVKTKKRLSEPG
jgi:autotransporter adhesin